MSRWVAAFPAAGLILAGAVMPALAEWDGDIGIRVEPPEFFAPCANIPCGTTKTLFVYAVLRGASASGITGAEYSILEDNPGGFLFVEDFEPAAAVVGAGAFGPGPIRGVNVAYDTCRIGDGTRVLLETLTVISTGRQCGETVRLDVVKHDTPSNPLFQCPLFTLCDAPAFTKVCLGAAVHRCPVPVPPLGMGQCSASESFIINPPPFVCEVSVAEPTWSGVKGLYR